MKSPSSASLQRTAWTFAGFPARVKTQTPIALGMVTLDSRTDLSAGGRVPNELVVLPAGFTTSTLVDDEGNPISWTTDVLAAGLVIAAFRELRRYLVVDYEHATERADERHDGTAPAAGWIKNLVWDAARGIVAKVDWLPLARMRIANREYRYFSPVFERAQFGDGVIRPVRLFHVGLTNAPAMKGILPIAAKNQPGAGGTQKGEDVNQLLQILGLGADATIEEVAAAVTDGNMGQVAAALGLPADASKDEVLAALRMAMGGSPESFKARLRCLRDAFRAEAFKSLAGASGASSSVQRHWYMRMIDQVCATRKVSRLDAVDIVQRERPALYQAFRDQSSGTAPQPTAKPVDFTPAEANAIDGQVRALLGVALNASVHSLIAAITDANRSKLASLLGLAAGASIAEVAAAMQAAFVNVAPNSSVQKDRFQSRNIWRRETAFVSIL